MIAIKKSLAVIKGRCDSLPFVFVKVFLSLGFCNNQTDIIASYCLMRHAYFTQLVASLRAFKRETLGLFRCVCFLIGTMIIV